MAVEPAGRGQRSAHVLVRHRLVGRPLGQAVVAGPALPGHALLTEVVADARVAARPQLGIREHLTQARVRAALRLRVAVRERLLDEERVEVAVGRRPEQDALRRLAVPPRPSGLLVVRLQAAGHVQVHHLADVRHVHPHAERRGGDHDADRARGEPVLDAPAFAILHLPVVVRRRQSAPAKQLGGLLGGGDRARVDQRPASARVQHRDQRLALAAVAPAAVGDQAQVGPVEARDQHERVAHPDAAHDVLADARRGRGRERRDGRAATRGQRPVQLPVLGPEVVAPGRDAVRLVHDEAGDPELGQAVEEARPREALGGDVQEAQPAVRGRLEPGHLLRPLLRRVDERGVDARRAEAVHLVLHQRDERRHHERQPVGQDRGDPVADALAGAGGRDGQHVAALELGLDHRRLAGPEALQAEHLAQHLESAVDHVPECAGSGRPGGTLYRVQLPPVAVGVPYAMVRHKLLVLCGAAAVLALAACGAGAAGSNAASVQGAPTRAG